MNRRTFGSLVTGALSSVVALVLCRSKLLRSTLMQTNAVLNQEQVRMENARRDLNSIVKAEISFMKRQKRFANLNELISGGDLDPTMSGRFGYVYAVNRSAKSIDASAHPLAGETLPAVYVNAFGPALDPVLRNLQESD
jgi:hypothetical protein